MIHDLTQSLLYPSLCVTAVLAWPFSFSVSTAGDDKARNAKQDS
jgi:hypothetical protein